MGLTEDHGASPDEPNHVFGTRYLVDKEKVYECNAWDNVEWSEQHLEAAEMKIAQQKENPVNNAQDLLKSPADQWDKFYNKNERKFFMDRHWLLKEFPELEPSNLDKQIQNGDRARILEVGCGVGNTTFPLMEFCGSDKAFIYSCDYSPTAVRLVRENDQYSEENCHAFVWDITEASDEVPEGSLDYIICIYVLSAIQPEKQKQAIDNLVRLLKPGGTLLFKDYGRYDLTQLRFKKDRFIDDNFYCRGDGTLVYFYTQDELHKLFTDAGLEKRENSQDRRLIVNRAKKVEMYRMWLKCKIGGGCFPTCLRLRLLALEKLKSYSATIFVMDTSYDYLYNRLLDVSAVINITVKVFTFVVIIKYTPKNHRYHSYFILHIMFWNFLFFNTLISWFTGYMDSSYDELYNRVLDVTAVIHISVKIFAMFTVIKYTPNDHRYHSYFILNIMFWNFLCNLIFTFTHLNPLFPAECFRLDGLSSLLGDNESFGHAMFLAELTALTNCGVALISAFPYRYIAFAYPHFAPNPRWVVLFCLGVHAVIAILVFPLSVKWTVSYDDYPNKAELPPRTHAFCFYPHGYRKISLLTTYLAFVVVVLIVVSAFSILILLKLRSKKQAFHSLTITLQRKLFVSLIFVTGITLLFGCIPLLITVTLVLFPHAPYARETVMVCIVLLLNHGSIYSVTYLVMFKVYRDAVKRMLLRLLFKKDGLLHVKYNNVVRSAVVNITP